jgi:hypothetical protein
MTDLYIYYKVRDDDAAALLPQVQAMQAELCAKSGISAQLKRRPTSEAQLQTWMEVYPAVDSAFEARLANAVVQAALAGRIAGARHTEVFEDIAPCA